MEIPGSHQAAIINLFVTTTCPWFLAEKKMPLLCPPLVPSLFCSSHAEGAFGKGKLCSVADCHRLQRTVRLRCVPLKPGKDAAMGAIIPISPFDGLKWP